MARTTSWVLAFALAASPAFAACAERVEDGALPLVDRVELQPLVAQVRRLLAALDTIGEPILTGEERRALEAAFASTDEHGTARSIQEQLDRHCLLGVTINPESRVKVARGPARAELVEQGWRSFLVKVSNEAGITAPLQISSPNALPLHRQVDGPDPPVAIGAAELRDRWLDATLFDQPPFAPRLSGLSLEYRIVQLFSRDAGRREASVSFHVGPGTADLGFRNSVALLCDARPSVDVKLRVRDEKGRPTTAAFVIRDRQGRVHPPPSKRLAPDFFFHEQIYRADGETVRLPAGEYHIECTRGPHYLRSEHTLRVEPSSADGALAPTTATFELRRWIDPASRGWWSGDHHVHAAGCAHYTDPSKGVGPADMLRHIIGEDLDVGCVLSWGPCWYHQKSFFEGKVSELSTTANVMRYDVEVSGFPSSDSGHLCLLGLTEDDYPGTTRIDEWPSFDLPILKWAKGQGAVAGFSHSGFGLETKDHALPSYEVPRYDGIGANEYVVDVTHDAVDFISAGDTPWPFELSTWYHTSNAGFRTRISGETDFPCITGERVGVGRVYAKLDGPLEYGAWLAAVKAGRSYVSEGHAHLFDFAAGSSGAVGAAGTAPAVDPAGAPIVRAVGVDGSELQLAKPGTITVRVRAAALLPDRAAQPSANPSPRELPLNQWPYWSIERARIPGSRSIPVEIVVNGAVAASRTIEADGKPNDLSFDVPIERSSWIACRIPVSAHTNPIYVLVGGRPIRASRRSVQWCLDGVEQCWRSKSPGLKREDVDACRAAYDHASAVYRARLAECDAD